MLVLSRKPGEKLIIGENITITVVQVTRGRVHLAFEAPHNVRILRAELAVRAKPTKWKRPQPIC